jgi:hypothetical protein
MRKHHLVAIKVSYHDHADVLAPHNRFRFNARFFELLDAIIKVTLDESHRRSPYELIVFVDLQPASCFELPFSTSSWVEYQAPSKQYLERIPASIARTAMKARTFFLMP